MNLWSLFLLGVPLIGLMVLAWCALRAPEGHEDADGFHSKQVYYDAFTDRRQATSHGDVPVSSPSL